MGTELQGITFSFAIRNEETGELEPIGEVQRGLEINLDREIPELKPIKLESDMEFIKSYEGTFDIKYMHKKFEYEVLGIKNSYYKHLKRVKNRNKLHMKRGK